ncbi:MAG TPA: hypothetical protein VF817_03290 [Patescibacteria group bacterium]
MKNPDESWEEYVYRIHMQHGQFAQLYGYEPFKELLEKGIVVPCVTGIRLMYTGAIDIIYQVNQEGRLVDIKYNDIFDLNCDSYDPKEVLSKRIGQGMWWEVEGIKPKGYDERRKEDETFM